MASGGGRGALWIPPSPPMAVGVLGPDIPAAGPPVVGVSGVLVREGETDVVLRMAEAALLPLSVRRCCRCCPAAT